VGMITSCHDFASSFTAAGSKHDIELGEPYQVYSYDSLTLTGVYKCSFDLQAFEKVEVYFEHNPIYNSQLSIIDPSSGGKEVLDLLVGVRMELDGSSSAEI